MDRSSKVEVSFYAEMDDGSEREVTVEAIYYPGYPAKVDGPWESCYPEEPSSIEVLGSFLEDGTPHDLTQEEHEKVGELVEAEVAESDDYVEMDDD